MPDPVKLTRKIPLDGHLITCEGLTVQTVPYGGKIIMQRSNIVTDRAMEALGQKLTQTFGAELPLQVCVKSQSKDGGITVLCLNPNSWMILCDEQDVLTVIEYVGSAAKNLTITASEMTDQYICLEITGRHARSLLVKGCALDLADEAFSESHTASTLLAQADIILWRNGKDGYKILCDVSLGNYLWRWLEGAAEEFTMK